MNLETDGLAAGAEAEAIAETSLVETPAAESSEATPEQPTGAETPAEPDAGAETEAQHEKRVPWFQKRINEVTADKYQAQREAAYWRGQAEAGGRQAQPTQPSGPPREDQFATWEEFESARIAHAVEQGVAQRLSAERENERNERVAREFSGRVAEFRNEHADYELIVDDLGMVATPLMVAVIRESEVGPKVAYHLGKNLSEAQRIAALPPHRQAAELGKLEDRLGKPAPTLAATLKPVPPAPPQTVAGLSAGLSKGPDDMSMSEYIAWRSQEAT